MAEFFLMPAASPTMDEGRLVGWKINEGDKSNDDVLNYYSYTQ